MSTMTDAAICAMKRDGDRVLKALRDHFACPDCEGSGEEGQEHYMGEFQPPERYPCSTCYGTGKATPYLLP